MLNDLLTDRQAKPCPLSVPAASIIQLSEVDEQFAQSLLRDPAARIPDADLKAQIMFSVVLFLLFQRSGAHLSLVNNLKNVLVIR